MMPDMENILSDGMLDGGEQSTSQAYSAKQVWNLLPIIVKDMSRGGENKASYCSTAGGFFLYGRWRCF